MNELWKGGGDRDVDAATEEERPKDSESLSGCGCGSYMLVVHGRHWRGRGSRSLNSARMNVLR